MCDMEPDQLPTFAGSWMPGWTVGTWVTRENPLSEQGQVLTANVMLALRRAPSWIARAIKDSLHWPDFKPTRSTFVDAAACLLRLAPGTFRKLHYRLQGRSWQPAPTRSWQPEPTQAEGDGGHGRTQPEEAKVLLTLTRAALSCIVTGGAKDEYVSQVCRLAQEGVAIGDQQHTHHFVDDVTHLGARCVQ